MIGDAMDRQTGLTGPDTDTWDVAADDRAAPFTPDALTDKGAGYPLGSNLRDGNLTIGKPTTRWRPLWHVRTETPMPRRRITNTKGQWNCCLSFSANELAPAARLPIIAPMRDTGIRNHQLRAVHSLQASTITLDVRSNGAIRTSLALTSLPRTERSGQPLAAYSESERVCYNRLSASQVPLRAAFRR